jgi:hypothetical protein
MTIGNSRYPYRCFAKLFVTWDKRSKLLRLGRLVWARGTMMHGGHTAKLSLALTPKLLHFSRDWNEWCAVLCGIRIHYQRSCGGVIV